MTRTPEISPCLPENFPDRGAPRLDRILLLATTATASVMLGVAHLNGDFAIMASDPIAREYLDRASVILNSCAILQATAGLLYAKAMCVKN